MEEPRTSTPFPEVAGHPALDLVDTVHWRLDPSRAIDTLTDFADVIAWCRQLGLAPSAVTDAALLTATPAATATREHRAVVALREAVYEAVFERSERAAELVAREHAAALSRSALRRREEPATWEWDVPHDATGPRAAIAMIAHDLLTADLASARQCADDACGWVYLDRSPRRNRIWCTAAGCGNRNRVKRHQAKRTS
ncbi:CGNR zinc finger domain-containing protein [Microbacterium oleivorans]|uniref:CGNR zinc finger domain-containing protein n=1 Tax=Microbacterium oleivorans TaxID=273677 RepID=A0A7D5JY97_9MICO|nr:CGNR zinc finger domain-containing protein [Microbacterium oleivorans]QLD11683.1 CGNR zinc finger domain-containing protein [Microbacterium oleivorans]